MIRKLAVVVAVDARQGVNLALQQETVTAARQFPCRQPAEPGRGRAHRQP